MAVCTWPVVSKHPALIYFLEKAFQPELADPKHQVISQISELLYICCTFQQKMSDPARSHFLHQISFILTHIITRYFLFTSDVFASLLYSVVP